MRTITKSLNLYNYDELSEISKEKVKEFYLDNIINSYDYKIDIEDYLKEIFPNSKLKIKFCLEYGQGDGLNIYGEFALIDIIPYITGLTEKEVKTLKFYDKKIWFYIDFAENNRYTYSLKERDRNDKNLLSTIFEDAQNARLRDFNKELVKKVVIFACDYFKNLDIEFENAGYKYFYEVDDEYISEWANVNEYEFTIDGNLADNI